MIMYLRLYWPKTEPPSDQPPGEGTWKPANVVTVFNRIGREESLPDIRDFVKPNVG